MGDGAAAEHASSSGAKPRSRHTADPIRRAAQPKPASQHLTHLGEAEEQRVGPVGGDLDQPMQPGGHRRQPRGRVEMQRGRRGVDRRREKGVERQQRRDGGVEDGALGQARDLFWRCVCWCFVLLARGVCWRVLYAGLAWDLVFGWRCTAVTAGDCTTPPPSRLTATID